MKRSKPSAGRGRGSKPSSGRGSSGPKRSFSKPGRFSKSKDDKPFSREKRSDDGAERKRPARSFGDKPSGFKRDDRGAGKPAFRRDDKPGERRTFSRGTGKPPFKRRTDGDDRPPRFNRDEKGSERPSFPRGDKPAFRKRSDGDERPARFNRDDRGGDKPFTRGAGRPDFKKRPSGEDRPSRFKRDDSKSDRPFTSREDKPERPDRREKPAFDKKRTSTEKRPRKEFEKNDEKRFERTLSKFGAKAITDRPSRDKSDSDSGSEYRGKRTFDKDSPRERRDRPWNRKEDHRFFGDKKKAPLPKMSEDGSIRLNKYIANAGICSRREADELISAGVVTVNGNVVTEMGYQVMPGDVVKYNNEHLRSERLVYILLNKPKDFITTTDDPEERKTVMSLIAKACKERVYPVGRLDRNTTGVLLFTNDGDLAKTLTHPSFEVHKVYQAELDRALKHTDMEQIINGVKLEDGFIKPDEVVYTTPEKDVIGMELHSGKNRIVRRIFEHLGYEVKKLDRVVFAGLTKKDLPRGRWRFLTEMEVASLKMMRKVKAKS